jgi:hypothetical protein
MHPDALAPLAGLQGLASLTLNGEAGQGTINGRPGVGGGGGACHWDRGPCDWVA